METMPTIKQLGTEIREIKERNKRVEADKAWETSWLRRSIIAILTYIVVVIFFFYAHLPNPLANAIIPALAFVVSTMTLSALKNIWTTYLYKKK